MKATGFDNASSERSRVRVILEQSEGSQTIVGKAKHLKTQDFLRLAYSHCKSNFKKKPALCEQQLLLAANKDKEWGMFERCIV